MLKTSSSRQSCLNWSRLSKVLAPLSLGVAVLTSAQMPVAAKPVVVVQPPLPTTSIIGSPIPSPVPVNPYTGNFCSFSPYECRSYDTLIIPGREVTRSWTLINPTVINSRGSDSVLVDQVIINSPGYPLRTFRDSSVIYSSPTYSSPIYSSPIYSSPTYSSPTYSSPTYSSPTYSSPIYSSPIYSSPIYSSPTYSSPGSLRIRVGR